MRLVVAVVAGFLINDVAVYSWHRWVSHAGILRWIGRDVFRRRHFHHHIIQYPPQDLHTPTYVESCDVTFGSVEVLLLVGAAFAMRIGTVPLSLTVAVGCGGALHGWLAIRIHELCHASDISAGQMALFRRPVAFAFFVRLRRFHDAHHTGRGNYGLLIPMIDSLVGTSVTRVPDASLLPSELFPGFRPERSSSCGEPLL